jgi:hypothetical protein
MLVSMILWRLEATRVIWMICKEKVQRSINSRISSSCTPFFKEVEAVGLMHLTFIVSFESTVLSGNAFWTADTSLAFAPTRCMKIPRDISAVFAETKGEQGKCITISHRWDDATKQAKTTERNYDERCRLIDFSTLPKVFQDTIQSAA